MRLIHPRLIAASFALLISSACTTPRSQAAIVQELNDAAGEIDGLKSDVADLQSSIDSLRTVAMKQDSVLNRILLVLPK